MKEQTIWWVIAIIIAWLNGYFVRSQIQKFKVKIAEKEF
jgi:hypothetical protein